jgi:dCMP deaminase
MDNRPSINDYFLGLAQYVSSRSTCREAQVGAVIVNSSNHVLATGYNGGLPGEPECSNGIDCKLTRCRPSGNITLCPTIHAEANALNQFRSNTSQVYLPPQSTAYVTTFPCTACIHQLIQAKVARVVYGLPNSWMQSGIERYGHIVNFEYHPQVNFYMVATPIPPVSPPDQP